MIASRPRPTAGLGKLRIAVFRGLQGLDALEQDWRALFDRLERPSYTQLWDWHRSYIEAELFDPDSLLFCALYDRDRLVAIIPLVRKTRRAFGVSLCLLSLPHHRLAPLSDILVEPRAVGSFDLAGVLRALRRELGEPWHAVRFGPTLEDSQASDAVRRLRTAHRGALVASPQSSTSNALKIAPYEEMQARFSKGFRKSLRRARNRLAELDGVALRSARDPEALQEAFAQFVALEASGWKGKAGTSLRDDGRLRAFFECFLDRLGPTGRCRINLLMHGERPIAGQITAVVGERLYLFKSAYDESYKQMAPSKLLRERVLQQLAEEPDIHYLDMISGQDWHGDWQPVQRRVFIHYICRAEPRGLAIWTAISVRTLLRAGRNSDAVHQEAD